MPRRCSKEVLKSDPCQEVNLSQGGLQTGVEHLFVLSISFSIDDHHYELPDVESRLDKFWVVL
jgi:hypothetical protein